jgi:hypothetical protein
LRDLTWWEIPKRAWIVIFLELAVITLLSGWLFSTYLNDVYFRSYVDSLSPALVPILSVAFGISSASIAIYLYLGMKRITLAHPPEAPVKNRTHSHKTSKRSQETEALQPKPVEQRDAAPAKLKPLAPPQNHPPTRKQLLKDRENHDPNAAGKEPTPNR